MADGVSVFASGTQTCVINTEHILIDSTSPGIFKVDIDLAAMTATTPDVMQIRYYANVDGTNKRQCFFVSYTGVQDSSTDALSAIKDLGGRPLGGINGFKITIKQTAGTGRAIPWIVTQVSP